jgi:hypothetical protein
VSKENALIDKLTEHIIELEDLYYLMKARFSTNGHELKTIALLRETRDFICTNVLDDSKPCTCGGKEDGWHSKACMKRSQ